MVDGFGVFGEAAEVEEDFEEAVYAVEHAARGASGDGQVLSAGADAAERKGRQQEYNRQRKLVTILMRRGTLNNDKDKIFALLDERVELSGDLAAAQYRVKKDKLRGKAKREQIKLQKSAKRKLRKNKHLIDKAVKRAKIRSTRKRRAKRQMVAGWIGLFVLAAAVFFIWYFRTDIGAALTDMINGLLGNVLGNL